MVESLLRAMRMSSTLKTLNLDLQHGGSYERPRTKKGLLAELALTMFAPAKEPNLVKA